MTAAVAFYEANGFTRDDTKIRVKRCSRGYRMELEHHESHAPTAGGPREDGRA